MVQSYRFRSGWEKKCTGVKSGNLRQHLSTSSWRTKNYLLALTILNFISSEALNRENDI